MDLNDGELEIDLEDLTYGLVSCDVPQWYRNPDFGVLFKDRQIFDRITDLVPITLAPGLHDVLNSNEPPSVDFFMTTPRPAEGQLWGIYALLMYKPGCAFKLYIGSGTNAESGVLTRISSYRADSSTLPRFVKQAFSNGYELYHIGLLCWTPLPSPGLIPKARGLILALEALMTFIFHAGIPKITDSYISNFLLWPRDTVVWEPLCSHTCLREGIRGDLELSEEQLELAAELRKSRSRELGNAKSQRHRKRRREEDEELYKENVTKAKVAWSEKNPSKVLKTAKKVREKAKESRLFVCDDCDIPFATAHALEKHLKCKVHLDKVTGIEKAPSKKTVATYREKRIQTTKEKAFYCSACDKAFPNDWSLTRHNDTKLHAKRLLRQSESP